MAKKKRIKVKEVTKRKSFAELKREQELKEQETKMQETQQDTESTPSETLTAGHDESIVGTGVKDESIVETEVDEESINTESNIETEVNDESIVEESNIETEVNDESIVEESNIETEVNEESNIETEVDEESNVETGVNEESNVETEVNEESKIETGVNDESNVEESINTESNVETEVNEETIVGGSLYSMGTGVTNYNVMDDGDEDDEIVTTGLSIGAIMAGGYIDLHGHQDGESGLENELVTYHKEKDDTAKDLGTHILGSSNTLNGEDLFGDGIDEIYKKGTHKPLISPDVAQLTGEDGVFEEPIDEDYTVETDLLEEQVDATVYEEQVTEIEVTKETSIDEPLTETEVNEESIIDESVTESEVNEEPIIEESVDETEVIEVPIIEESVDETEVPEESINKEPVTESEVIEVPIIEEPVTDAEVPEESIIDESVTESEVNGEPNIEEPVTEAEVNEEPIIEEPVVETEVYEEPIIEEPVVETEVYEEPIIEESVDEAEVYEEPIIEDPVVETEVIEEPIIEDSVDEAEVSEEPINSEPLTETEVYEEPINMDSVDEAEVSEEPINSEPLTETEVYEEPINMDSVDEAEVSEEPINKESKVETKVTKKRKVDDLPPVKYQDMEMYKALLAYSDGGMLGEQPADLRGITHIAIEVFDEMYDVSQAVLIGTDNTETIELPYEGNYIGAHNIRGETITPLRPVIKTTYYVSYTGNFYKATNDLKLGKRVNLAGEFVDPVEPEEGMEAIIVQSEHKDGVTFEYKVKDLTKENERLGLKTLTSIQKTKKGRLFGRGKDKKDKPVKNKKSFFSSKDKGADMVNNKQTTTSKGKPVKGQPVKGRPVKGRPVKGKPVKGKPVKGRPVKGKPVKGKPVKGKPVKERPYSRYAEVKPTFWNRLPSWLQAVIMGLGFMIVILTVGSKLFAPSDTIDYLAFNDRETLMEVAEDSFGKNYVSSMENQAFIYFEPRHKEVKVTFLETLEAYMNSGDEGIKTSLDTITVQYFANLEFVQEQALIKYQRNKQKGDTSDLTLNFEKNHNKLQEVLGGSVKDYTGRVMNGYSDTSTLRTLIGVDTNQEVGTFLSHFTDNVFYVYYNYVINQADPLLAGVTDERDEVDAEGETVEQGSITTEVEETEEVTQ